MGPTWGWQDLGGPHIGPMNLAIWDIFWLTWPCLTYHSFACLSGHNSYLRMVVRLGKTHEIRNTWKPIKNLSRKANSPIGKYTNSGNRYTPPGNLQNTKTHIEEPMSPVWSCWIKTSSTSPAIGTDGEGSKCTGVITGWAPYFLTPAAPLSGCVRLGTYTVLW